MAPTDTSPDAGEIMREPPPQRRFAQPKPGRKSGVPAPGGARDPGKKPDIAHRPSLPEHPRQMAVDVEDEEEDPVIDSGPGIADGVKRLKKHGG